MDGGAEPAVHFCASEEESTQSKSDLIWAWSEIFEIPNCPRVFHEENHSGLFFCSVIHLGHSKSWCFVWPNWVLYLISPGPNSSSTRISMTWNNPSFFTKEQQHNQNGYSCRQEEDIRSAPTKTTVVRDRYTDLNVNGRKLFWQQTCMHKGEKIWKLTPFYVVPHLRTIR